MEKELNELVVSNGREGKGGDGEEGDLLLEGESGNPPYFWDGENTKPNEMAKYMFGDEEGNTKYSGGHKLVEKEFYPARKRDEPNYVAARNRYPKRRERYKQLEEEIIARMKDEVGLEVGIVKKKKEKDMVAPTVTTGKKSGCLGNSRGDRRTVNLMCMNCACVERNEYSPVIRMSSYEEEREANMMEYGYRIMDVFFHNVDCCKDRLEWRRWYVGLGGEERKGWKVLGSGDDKKCSKKELQRSAAFQRWIEKLEPCGKDVLVELKGAVVDGGCEEFAVTRWLAWILYEVICKLNLVEEWTQHIPHRSPGPCVGKAYGPGQFPLTERGSKEMPVHLYMAHLYLIVGGMKLDGINVREVWKEEEKAEAEKKKHGSGVKCKLLKELTPPMALYVALEDERRFWLENGDRTVTVKKNELIAMSCDLKYSGSWFGNKTEGKEEDKTNHEQQGYPLFHGRLLSKQYPVAADEKEAEIEAESELGREHMFKESDEGIVASIERGAAMLENAFFHYYKRGMDSEKANVILERYGMLQKETRNRTKRKKS